MGNWRHRPRRRPYRHRSPAWPPRKEYVPEPPPEFWQDGIPLWEKKFCIEIAKVPWQKIVEAKESIHCHTNILNWNDSAGEEALKNAKMRYWSEINGSDCDIALPDPDFFIDKVDWNAYLDSDMGKELDLGSCAYEAGEEVRKCKRQKSRNMISVSSRLTRSPDNGDNTSEHNMVQVSETTEDDPKRSDNRLDPWNSSTQDKTLECSFNHGVGGLSNKGKGGYQNELSGWNSTNNLNNGLTDLVRGENIWEQCRREVVSQKADRWDGSGNNSWSWGHQALRNLNDDSNPRYCSFSRKRRYPMTRQCQDSAEVCGRKQWSGNNNAEDRELGRVGRWGAQNVKASQRTESSGRFKQPDYISSGRQGRDYYQKDNGWRGLKTRKRVSFAPD